MEIESKFLEKLHNGDYEAFDMVFNKYHRYLYVVAYRYLKDESASEDAVQYVFTRLWENKNVFDYRQGIKNLLFTILKNYVLNEIRHNNLAVQKHYEIAQKQETSVDFLQEIEQRDSKKYLNKLIKKLPMQKRIVCMLKINMDLSNEEVAKKMKISVNTVKSHYQSALKTLRMQLNNLF
ncbi:MAG: RNA polymerase sigma-70 factor [Bacteroidales bacterium]|jgi:RNA polymerase sigma-70 factor (ECF subfamily)|nr:RNA polymerase sigma-70 factor [Bacteroidales bacterium]